MTRLCASKRKPQHVRVSRFAGVKILHDAEGVDCNVCAVFCGVKRVMSKRRRREIRKLILFALVFPRNSAYHAQHSRTPFPPFRLLANSPFHHSTIPFSHHSATPSPHHFITAESHHSTTSSHQYPTNPPLHHSTHLTNIGHPFRKRPPSLVVSHQTTQFMHPVERGIYARSDPQPALPEP